MRSRVLAAAIGAGCVLQSAVHTGAAVRMDAIPLATAIPMAEPVAVAPPMAVPLDSSQMKNAICAIVREELKKTIRDMCNEEKRNIRQQLENGAATSRYHRSRVQSGGTS